MFRFQYLPFKWVKSININSDTHFLGRWFSLCMVSFTWFAKDRDRVTMFTWWWAQRIWEYCKQRRKDRQGECSEGLTMSEKPGKNINFIKWQQQTRGTMKGVRDLDDFLLLHFFEMEFFPGRQESVKGRKQNKCNWSEMMGATLTRCFLSEQKSDKEFVSFFIWKSKNC